MSEKETMSATNEDMVTVKVCDLPEILYMSSVVFKILGKPTADGKDTEFKGNYNDVDPIANEVKAMYDIDISAINPCITIDVPKSIVFTEREKHIIACGDDDDSENENESENDADNEDENDIDIENDAEFYTIVKKLFGWKAWGCPFMISDYLAEKLENLDLVLNKDSTMYPDRINPYFNFLGDTTFMSELLNVDYCHASFGYDERYAGQSIDGTSYPDFHESWIENPERFGGLDIQFKGSFREAWEQNAESCQDLTYKTESFVNIGAFLRNVTLVSMFDRMKDFRNIDESTFNIAVYMGDMDVIEYLDENDCPFDKYLWTCAVSGGHQKVIEFLTENIKKYSFLCEDEYDRPLGFLDDNNMVINGLEFFKMCFATIPINSNQFLINREGFKIDDSSSGRYINVFCDVTHTNNRELIEYVYEKCDGKIQKSCLDDNINQLIMYNRWTDNVTGIRFNVEKGGELSLESLDQLDTKNKTDFVRNHSNLQAMIDGGLGEYNRKFIVDNLRDLCVLNLNSDGRSQEVLRKVLMEEFPGLTPDLLILKLEIGQCYTNDYVKRRLFEKKYDPDLAFI